jgi:hypothetical protein
MTTIPFEAVLERGTLNEICVSLLETHNDHVAAGLECRGQSFQASSLGSAGTRL